MSHKNLAVGTVSILVFSIILTALLATSCSALENINPIAALTAINRSYNRYGMAQKNTLTVK